MKYSAATLFLTVLVIPLFARTIEVCPTCSIKDPFLAIERSLPGDTLRFAKGEYLTDHMIVVDHPLTLLGENGAVIHGKGDHTLLLIASDSVTVSGFRFENVQTHYTQDLSAILIENARYFNVTDNYLHHTFFGIYGRKSECGIIERNTVIGNAVDEFSSANAIHLWYCDQVEVKDNETAHHRDGIYFEFVNHCHIEGNLSRNNLRYGLHFMFSNDDGYYDNTFRDNGAGVAVMFSKRIDMVGNRFEENWGTASYGLLLKEIYDGRIAQNEFVRNTIGVYSEGATRMYIRENRFERNGWAIRMRGSSMDNKVIYNSFLGNSFDLATESSRNNNQYLHNYWDQYSGYDLDRDGFGDVPYRPVRLFSFLVERIDASIILLRSPFVSVLDRAEEVTPSITPVELFDEQPLMHPLP